MMAMVKIVLLFLVVLEATALQNSDERDSNHELYPYSSPSPSPLSYPPFPSPSLAPSSPDVDQEKKSKELCAAECVLSCIRKPSFLKAICLGICLARCAKSSSDSLYEVNCTMDCAQSSTNSLHYDANMMDDRVSSCYQQCKRD